MKAFRILAVAVAALALLAGAAGAGSLGRLGTSGAPELRLPVGGRNIAIAGSDLATVSGVEALFYNPAGVAQDEAPTQLMFSNTQYIADMQVNYFGVAQNMGGIGYIGLSAKVLSIGDIVETTEQAPDGTGAIFSPTYSTLGLTWSKALTDRVNFGATFYYISEKILQETSAGAAFDFGFQYDTGVRGTRFGVSVKNIGPNMAYSGTDFEFITPIPGSDPQATGRNVTTQSAEYELPTSLQLSLAVPVVVGPSPFNVYGTYSSNSFGNDEGRIGAEWTVRRMLSLRGGYIYDGTTDALFQYSYGVGLQFPFGASKMHLDWASQPVHGGYFNDVQVLSVNMTF